MEAPEFLKLRPKIDLEPSTRKPILVGFGIIAVTSLLFAVAWFSLPPQIPLFYSRPWGEGQLGQPLFLLLPLLLGLIFLVVNAILAKKWEDSFLKHSLIFGGVLASLFASITIVRILLLLF